MSNKPTIQIFAAILLAICLILFSTYYYLGGFEPLTVYEQPAQAKMLVGKHFYGKPNDPKLKMLFDEIRESVLACSSCEFNILDYTSAEKNADSVHYFLAAAFLADMVEVPDGFDLIEIETKKRFTIFLGMHPLVRPTPAQVEKLLTSKANQLQEKWESFLMQIHYPDNSMAVELWTK